MWAVCICYEVVHERCFFCQHKLYLAVLAYTDKTFDKIKQMEMLQKYTWLHSSVTVVAA